MVFVIFLSITWIFIRFWASFFKKLLKMSDSIVSAYNQYTASVARTFTQSCSRSRFSGSFNSANYGCAGGSRNNWKSRYRPTWKEGTSFGREANSHTRTLVEGLQEFFFSAARDIDCGIVTHDNIAPVTFYVLLDMIQINGIWMMNAQEPMALQ